MRVDAITELEFPQLWELRLRALKTDPEAFGRSYEETAALPADAVAEWLQRSCRPPEQTVLGAWLEGTLVGMVGLRRMEGAKDRHKAGIWGMWVAPEARGRGIGRRLIAGAIERARAIPGIEQVGLTVVTTKTEALALYRSAGFVAWGLERNALRQGERAWDEEHMVLSLLQEA